MSYRTQKYRALKRERELNNSDTGNSSDYGLNSSSSMMNISLDISDMSISTNPNDSLQKSNDHPRNSSGDIGVDGEQCNREVSRIDNLTNTDLIGQGTTQGKTTSVSFIDEHLSETSSGSGSSDDDESQQSSSLSDARELDGEEDEKEDEKTLADELRDIAMKHINCVTHSYLNDLLRVLRSKGHADLPKRAETLLRTQRTQNRIQPMLSKKGTYGSYMYLGIEAQLRKQLMGSGYNDKEIRVLVNIDGLPIYNRSKQQMWPILLKISHKDYYCKPFVAALYCGDSKPHDNNDFCEDFVNEVTKLTVQGLEIESTLFSIRFSAFVCDTPARAFVNGCKGHTGFYGCERCTTRGKTVNKKRVYPQMNCRLRTADSFREKRQPEHHLPNVISPLVRIPGFDPVAGVVLDYMHLLCCGVMKQLFEKWLSTKTQKGSIGRRERYHCTELLLSLSSQIPTEFQRKKLDLTDVANWKATQYRFVLLYAGGVVLRQVLSSESYLHFLHLFAACRILCSRAWALTYTNEAQTFLRIFFKDMPAQYGNDSQVMNFHNLIHLADDVRHMQAPLTEYSSFPFENCLGHIKRLIRMPRNPIAQVFRRLSENESISPTIQKYETGINNGEYHIQQTKRGAKEISTVEYTKIKIRTMTVCTVAPDNVVKLANGEIVEISRIFSNNSKKLFLSGRVLDNKGDAFKVPMASSRLGIYRIKDRKMATKIDSIDNIVDKCMLLSVEGRRYAITLLHLE